MPLVTPLPARARAPLAGADPTVRLVSEHGEGWGGCGGGPLPTLRTCPCPPPPTAATPDQPYTIVPTPPLAYSTLGVVVSLVALVALLVAVVAAALCYRHRQKGKENRHLAVAYTAGRTDTSEYVVPGERHAGPRLSSPPPPRGPVAPGLTPVPQTCHRATRTTTPTPATTRCPSARCLPPAPRTEPAP